MKKKIEKLPPSYSGDKSLEFWKRVGKIPRTQGGEGLYLLGCALQELESRVLGWLDLYEKKRFKRKK